MVQREVRKKTRIYGTAGFLSAITLVALIYAFGVAPLVFNPAASSIKTFSSYEELKNFLNVNTRGNSYSVYSGGPLDARSFGSSIATNMPVPAPAAPSSAALRPTELRPSSIPPAKPSRATARRN